MLTLAVGLVMMAVMVFVMAWTLGVESDAERRRHRTVLTKTAPPNQQ